MPGAFLPFCPLGYFFSLRLSVELFLGLFSRPGCSRRHPRPPPRAYGSSAVWHEPRGQGVQGETPSRPLRRPFTSSPAAPPWGERLRGTDVFWLRRVCVGGRDAVSDQTWRVSSPRWPCLWGQPSTL